MYWSQSRESTTQFNTDLATLRASGRCVLLSVGGAGSYIQLDTQDRSDAFVASVKSIYAQLGGFDGIDFDIEGGTVWILVVNSRNAGRCAPFWLRCRP